MKPSYILIFFFSILLVSATSFSYNILDNKVSTTQQITDVARTIYKSENTQTNATGLTWVTLYTIPLVADTNYTIYCYMLHASNVTTSGIRYNITLAGNPDYMRMSMEASTSATAKQQSVVSTTTKRDLMPTAVTASLAVPSFLPDTLIIYIDGNANTEGNANILFSGELVNLVGIVGKGSYCYKEIVT